MIIDWIVRQPWSRRHPHLSGMLFGFGMLFVLAIIMPPVFWLLSQIGWLFQPLLRVMAWWWKLWGGGV